MTLNVLISIAIALYALTGLGITRSPGAALAAWLPGALGAPALEPLYAALGWSQSAVIGRLTSAWNVLGAAGQDFLVFALFLVLVGALLGTVLTLYFSWVFFMHGSEAR